MKMASLLRAESVRSTHATGFGGVSSRSTRRRFLEPFLRLRKGGVDRRRGLLYVVIDLSKRWHRQKQ